MTKHSVGRRMIHTPGFPRTPETETPDAQDERLVTAVLKMNCIGVRTRRFPNINLEIAQSSFQTTSGRVVRFWTLSSGESRRPWLKIIISRPALKGTTSDKYSCVLTPQKREYKRTANAKIKSQALRYTKSLKGSTLYKIHTKHS